MAESGVQRRICDVLVALLRSYFTVHGGRPMLVGGNQFFYWREGRPDLRIAPDVYVIEDEVEDIKSWLLWEHGGKGPALAVEVVSDEYEKDYEPKQLVARYQELGVREVLRYDPEAHLHPRTRIPRKLLTHWVRDANGALVEVPLANKHSTPSRLYDFWFVHQPPRSLRLGIGPEGRKLWPTPEERAQQAEERAQQAEEEIARLRAELVRRDR